MTKKGAMPVYGKKSLKLTQNRTADDIKYY